tara:strand:+ start:232 stop:555 length:324 start_codon:yes stop_codon:yes gene_type:complete
MIIEVKQWPESQEVMENSNWFFIMAPRTDAESDPIGDSSYARILDESEYILVEPTTADEYNNKWLNENKYNEIKELITDLEWETDRMSSSGRETLDALWKIFKIEGN